MFFVGYDVLCLQVVGYLAVLVFILRANIKITGQSGVFYCWEKDNCGLSPVSYLTLPKHFNSLLQMCLPLILLPVIMGPDPFIPDFSFSTAPIENML